MSVCAWMSVELYKKILFSLVYGILTVVGYLMPNPVYIILDIYIFVSINQMVK